MTDKDDRYWVAVGPNVTNPNHKAGKPFYATAENSGIKMDAVFKDSEGNTHYLPLITGDGKAHTYPNGIYQTGYSYPDGKEYVPGTGEGGGVIEFIGKGKSIGFNEYELQHIIVYD